MLKLTSKRVTIGKGVRAKEITDSEGNKFAGIQVPLQRIPLTIQELAQVLRIPAPFARAFLVEEAEGSTNTLPVVPGMGAMALAGHAVATAEVVFVQASGELIDSAKLYGELRDVKVVITGGPASSVAWLDCSMLCEVEDVAEDDVVLMLGAVGVEASLELKADTWGAQRGLFDVPATGSGIVTPTAGNVTFIDRPGEA